MPEPQFDNVQGA